MSDAIRNCDLPATPAPIVSQPRYGTRPSDRVEDAALTRAVDFILDDCFFIVGQAVGMRLTIEYDAVIWWRDHYRAKLLAAMRSFGDRWSRDRQNVSAVALLLAERAVRHAGTRGAIDVESARRAAADVERYCQLHARRHASACARGEGGDESPRVAGYWCTEAFVEDEQQ